MTTTRRAESEPMHPAQAAATAIHAALIAEGFTAAEVEKDSASRAWVVTLPWPSGNTMLTVTVEHFEVDGLNVIIGAWDDVESFRQPDVDTTETDLGAAIVRVLDLARYSTEVDDDVEPESIPETKPVRCECGGRYHRDDNGRAVCSGCRAVITLDYIVAAGLSPMWDETGVLIVHA